MFYNNLYSNPISNLIPKINSNTILKVNNVKSNAMSNLNEIMKYNIEPENIEEVKIIEEHEISKQKNSSNIMKTTTYQEPIFFEQYNMKNNISSTNAKNNQNINKIINSKNTVVNTNNRIEYIITDNDYYISFDEFKIYNMTIYNSFDFIIINAKNIYLPIISLLYTGITLKIINNTGNILNIYSQNNDIIYSNLYTSKIGTKNIIIQNKSLFMFYLINIDGENYWIIA